MSVLVDARRAVWNPDTGTGIYAQQLVNELEQLMPRAGLDVWSESLVSPHLTGQGAKDRLERWPRKIVSDTLEIRRRCQTATLFHAMYPETWPNQRIPIVVTIQDLDVMRRGPRHATSARYYAASTRYLAAHASHILVPSTATRMAVLDELAPRCPVSVVLLGTDILEMKPAEVDTGGKPFFLYTGGAGARKDVAGLFNTWAKIHAKCGAQLVVTGWKQTTEAPGVVFIGRVDRSQLRFLYEHCVGVLYLSPLEGFGFPLIEAATLGAAAICRPTGVVADLPPGVVRVVRDDDEVASAAEEALAGWRPFAADVEWCRETFSWRRCAEHTLAVYEATA